MCHRRLCAALRVCAIALPLLPESLPSQERRTVALSIAVSDGEAPVANAEVRLRGTARVVRTDSAGRARVSELPSRPYIVEVRRLGFRPDTSEVLIEPADTIVQIVLRPNAQELAAVKVLARNEGFDPAISEMLERWLSGQYRRSSFISRAQLENGQYARVTDALRQTPGVRLRTGRDGRMRVVSTRYPVRVGGGGCRQMNVYLDGVPLKDIMNPDGFAVDQIPVGDLAGIEVYQSNATGPIQYNSTGFDCGVLLLWTRRR